MFTAEAGEATLRFENDSPECDRCGPPRLSGHLRPALTRLTGGGDRSIFVDAISVSVAVNALKVVLPSSSAEKQLYDFQLLPGPPGRLSAISVFLCKSVLYSVLCGRARCLAAKNGGFRPGQGHEALVP